MLSSQQDDQHFSGMISGYECLILLNSRRIIFHIQTPAKDRVYECIVHHNSQQQNFKEIQQKFINIHLLYEYIYEYVQDPQRIRIQKNRLSYVARSDKNDNNSSSIDNVGNNSSSIDNNNNQDSLTLIITKNQSTYRKRKKSPILKIILHRQYQQQQQKQSQLQIILQILSRNQQINKIQLNKIQQQRYDIMKLYEKQKKQFIELIQKINRKEFSHIIKELEEEKIVEFDENYYNLDQDYRQIKMENISSCDSSDSQSIYCIQNILKVNKKDNLKKKIKKQKQIKSKRQNKLKQSYINYYEYEQQHNKQQKQQQYSIFYSSQNNQDQIVKRYQEFSLPIIEQKCNRIQANKHKRQQQKQQQQSCRIPLTSQQNCTIPNQSYSPFSYLV